MHRHTHLRIAAVLLGLAAGAPQARAAGPAEDFVKTAVQGNLAEIAVGKLAHTKGTTPALREYGQMLVDDHTKFNQQATELAKSMTMKVPLEAGPAEVELQQRLAKEPPHTFDTDFINAELQDHQKTIDIYEKAADALKGQPAGTYASSTLPVLHKHLQAIQKIAKDMGI